MKDLQHLPPQKQKELKRLVEIINKHLPAELILLFGSHARGDWVQDRYREGDTTYEYSSDYDLLIVVGSESTERDYLLKESLIKKIHAEASIETPVSILLDTVQFVNGKLAEGNYFYLDIVREGAVLFDSHKIELKLPLEPTPQQIYTAAKENYDFWMSKAESFMKDYQHNMLDHEYANAAFHLSQVVEAYLFALLLVHTGYKPKSHNIERIEQLVAEVVPGFTGVFIRDTDEKRRLFDLLKRAYIEARYSKDYEVREGDLSALEKRVAEFADYAKLANDETLSRLRVI